MPRERWRNVKRAPGLKVSSQGRVRWLPHVLPDGREHGGGPLEPWLNEDGYRCVTIRGETVKVCHLVLEAFSGPRPYGLEACHGPDGRQADHADVLRWDTHQENIRDKERHKARQPERLDWHCDTIRSDLGQPGTAGAAGA